MSRSRIVRGVRSTRLAFAVAAWLLAASQAAAGGLTVTVPGDYATIQEAVDAVQSNASPGEVVVESDGVFDELVVINESVTLRAGAGFSPTLEQVGSALGTLLLFGDPDDETEVVVEGLTVRLVDSGSAAAVSIRNVSDSDRLEVRLAGVVIEVENSGFGVRAESGNGGAVDLEIVDSTVEVVGAQAGSPSCMRLGGVGYDLDAFIAGNRFRFSDADGLVLLGGGNQDEKDYAVLANVFESFASAVGEGRVGVQVQGWATSMTNLSSADVLLLSNLFVANERAIRAFSSFEHEILLVATNNTIVDTRFNAVEIGAVADSAITAGLANNVIAGTMGIPGEGGGFGVIVETSDQGVVDLIRSHNLLFDNAAGDYGGIAMPGPGDLFADPLFVAPAGGDYRLLASSPAIDAGDNEPAPAGGVGLFDLALGPRILDGDLDGVAIVDIGAYERVTQPLEVPALSTVSLLLFAVLLAAAAAWRLHVVFPGGTSSASRIERRSREGGGR